MVKQELPEDFLEVLHGHATPAGPTGAGLSVEGFAAAGMHNRRRNIVCQLNFKEPCGYVSGIWRHLAHIGALTILVSCCPQTPQIH